MSSPAGSTRWSTDDEAILTALAQDLAAGREIRLPHPHAADATGSVAVTVDGDGVVVGVDVDPDWPEVIAPEAVAGAVFEAYRAALVQAAHGRILLQVAKDRAAAERAPAARAGDDRYLPPDDPVERERWRADVWSAAADAQSRARQVLERSARPVERPVHGRYGLFTVRLRNRTIVGVDGSPNRIAAASADQLRLEALRVLRGDGPETGPQRPERT